MIHFYYSFGEFIDSEIKKSLDDLAVIRDQIITNTFEGFNLEKIVKNQIINTLEGWDLNYTDLLYPSYFENPTLYSIDDVDNINDIDVRKLFDSRLLVSFSFQANIIIDFFIEKSKYFSYVDEKEYFCDLDRDWNEWYVYASKDYRAKLQVSFIFNLSINEIENTILEELIIISSE